MAISIILIIIGLGIFLFNSKIVEKNEKMKKYFKTIRIIFVILLVLLLLAWIIRAVLFWLFPSIEQSLALKGELEVHLFAIGILILLIFAWFIVSMIFTSINREDFIKRIIKIVLGIALLLFAYWVYPSGVLSTPISMITLGNIGRLLMVLMLGVAFLIDVYCLIEDIP